MATIVLVSFEIHPVNPGGCGVLLHHAARHLLDRGHRVVFLLDMPLHEVRRFDEDVRPRFPHGERCAAYQVDALCADFVHERSQIGDLSIWKSLRFAYALERLATREKPDFVEFFEYTGAAYYALVSRLFTPDADGPTLGVRLHTSLEVMDAFAATNTLDRVRYNQYALEHATLTLAETVLAPMQPFVDTYYTLRYRLDPAKVVIAQSPKVQTIHGQPPPARDGSYSILFFGRLFNMKGADQFVQAAVMLLRARPELRARFLLVGYDGAESPFGRSYAAYLRTLIPAALLDRFEFTGQLTHAEVDRRLANVLFAVFPNRLESFCYAVHEIYDAGVPVIANSIPAFTAFFQHERNALIYDGTTEALVAAMQRMIDDDTLRTRLRRPYAVATEPLGPFYDTPHARTPLTTRDTPQPLRPLVVLLARGDHSALAATQAALDAQTCRTFDIAHMNETEGGTAEAVWWLGRSWVARRPGGEPLAPTTWITGDALAILDAGDRPAPRWVEHCSLALSRRPQLAFAGTWLDQGGRVLPHTIDLTPETWPFEHGPRRTRVMIRTDPGRLAVDALDGSLGELGEVGLLWSAIARFGRGAVLPQPELTIADEQPPVHNVNLLHYLLARYGAVFADRLLLYAGILQDRVFAHAANAGAPSAIHPAPTVEQKRRYAAELGGRDLLRIVTRKASARLRGKTYEG